MTEEDFRRITPWAPDRLALYEYLKRGDEYEHEGNPFFEELPTYYVTRIPFAEVISYEPIFFAIVEPAMEDPKSDDYLPVLLDLLERTVNDLDLQTSIALYQLLLYFDFSHQWRLAKLIEGNPILDDSRVYDYALWLVQNSPDIGPVRFALTAIQFSRRTPPEFVLRVFLLHREFFRSASITVAAHFQDVEEDLMAIARQTGGWERSHALLMLTSVVNPENQMWLLREGWKNYLDDYETAFHAAEVGDLIGHLRAETIEDPEVVVDFASVLSEICGGALGAKRLNDLPDGIEACLHLIRHCEKCELNEALFWRIYWIVNFAAGMRDRVDIDGSAWGRIVDEGNRYLGRADWPRGIHAEWAMRGLKERIELALSSGEFQAVVEWAVSFLCLNDDDPLAQKRRWLELDGYETSCCEGWDIPGSEDRHDFRSVYGQALLQLLEMLKSSPGQGEKIIIAGLESDWHVHRQLAEDALAKWSSDRLTPEMVAALATSEKRDVSDEDALIRKRLDEAVEGEDPDDVIQARADRWVYLNDEFCREKQESLERGNLDGAERLRRRIIRLYAHSSRTPWRDLPPGPTPRMTV